MKKLFLVGAFLLSIFTLGSAYAYGPAAGFGGGFGGGYGSPSCPQPTGDCYCQFVEYCPCYYNTTRCVQECYPCYRTCCCTVPEYYQVQKCCYVPQYYCETRCRPCKQYYQVCDYKTCNRTICEPQCTYVPRYYWKRTCGPVGPGAGY